MARGYQSQCCFAFIEILPLFPTYSLHPGYRANGILYLSFLRQSILIISSFLSFQSPSGTAQPP